MLKVIDSLLQHISIDAGFITCIVFLIYRKSFRKGELIIVALVVLYFSFDCAAFLLGHFYKSNQWFYNIAILIEISLLFYIYYRLFNYTYIKRAIKYAYPGFLFFFLINYFFIQGQYVFNNYTFVPSYAFLALLAYLHLQQCVDQLTENPFSNFYFWVSMANLLDFTVSAPLLGILSWFAFENEKIARSLYTINEMVYVAWFSILSIGIIWTSRLRK